jgi:chloramphenicol 3-O phosphotransferase
VDVDIIVLNGGSSSGKSTLATCLQQELDGTWITLGVDDLIRAMSYGPSDTEAGGSLRINSDGTVIVGAKFRDAEVAWYRGLAAMAGAGLGIIIDEVFLEGATSQDRLRRALSGLAVLWVGVQCTPETAEAREIERGDRTHGMARLQAALVHEGVDYDIVVDTTDSTSAQCATRITAWMRQHSSP